jgi:para-nitrobenzyl esterase
MTSPSPDGLRVKVTGGVVSGARRGGTLEWRGIPYAAPPVGPLRFRAPQPVRPWLGVREASDFGRVATQVYQGQFRGTPPSIPSGEDCLTLNVIRPAHVSQSVRLPVMVYIHGGGYSAGSSRDFTGQGESFVRSGQVVYVSFNYRLGALGYLDFSRYSKPSRPIDANLGLRDQVAVLQWVRTNIRAFGGDPHNVTLFGESAGGNAVTTLFAVPTARSLFARGIAQSSPANAVYSRELGARWAEEFVEILGRRTLTVPSNDDEIVELLTSTSAFELVTAALTLQGRVPGTDPGTFPLAPIVDGRFLPRHPMEAFRTGRAHRVSLIIGSNDREGSVFRGRIDILPRSPARITALFARAPESARAAMSACYPGLPSGRAASDFGGDYAFWYPSVMVADWHSRYAPVYTYRFDVAPRLLRLVGLDATHGIEMFALFDQQDDRFTRAITALGGRGPFTQAGTRMRDSWLKFAQVGRPGSEWPRYTEAQRRTKIIAEVDRVESDPRADRRRAWSGFHPIQISPQ